MGIFGSNSFCLGFLSLSIWGGKHAQVHTSLPRSPTLPSSQQSVLYWEGFLTLLFSLDLKLYNMFSILQS